VNFSFARIARKNFIPSNAVKLQWSQKELNLLRKGFKIFKTKLRTSCTLNTVQNVALSVITRYKRQKVATRWFVQGVRRNSVGDV
jgi:hypothetical protein